jgi:hypothetical protein
MQNVNTILGNQFNQEDAEQSELMDVDEVFCCGIRCPHCEAIIVTPKYFKLKEGVGTCNLCMKDYRLTEPLASYANKLSEICCKVHMTGLGNENVN